MGTVCPGGSILLGLFVQGDRKSGAGSAGIKWVLDQMCRSQFQELWKVKVVKTLEGPGVLQGMYGSSGKSKIYKKSSRSGRFRRSEIFGTSGSLKGRRWKTIIFKKFKKSKISKGQGVWYIRSISRALVA